MNAAKVTPPDGGPKCCICDELLRADDKVVAVQRMYQSSPTSWPTALHPNTHAHLHHFMARADS